MGLLQDGQWVDQWQDTKASGGRFVRNVSQFRNWVTADGSAGPTGGDGFKAEPGRYHLYVSLACPWAHRALMMCSLKGLHELISVSTVHWKMGNNGWTFQPGDGATPDPIHGAEFMHQVYTAADNKYSGRVTVPVLWDREKKTIVSNESADLTRMLNSAFDDIGASTDDYYPQAKRAEIDKLNERIYSAINNGVYKAGFATTQLAYDEAIDPLFDALDWLEALLESRRYLTGNQLTEADIRLFTTLIRFDPVYVGHFKCNLRRIADYPNLSAYLKDIGQIPGVADTIDYVHIKNHYYVSHKHINPTGIVPAGPVDY